MVASNTYLLIKQELSLKIKWSSKESPFKIKSSLQTKIKKKSNTCFKITKKFPQISDQKKTHSNKLPQHWHFVTMSLLSSIKTILKNNFKPQVPMKSPLLKLLKNSDSQFYKGHKRQWRFQFQIKRKFNMKFFTPFLLKVKPKEWELFSGKNKTKKNKMNEKNHK